MVKIPTRLEELIPAAAMQKVLDVLSQPDIPSSVREALGKVGWKDANPLGQVQDAWQQARSWLETLSSQGGAPSTAPSILNATGELLQADFDGVPMASSVAYGYAKTAATFQSAQALQAKAKQVAGSVLGHPTLWLNSPQLALQLLQSVALASSGIVISRADSVRVPGFGDVRAMLTAGAGQLVEVGAANGASEDDWSQAVHSADQLLLLVSPNNLGLEAAVEQRASAIRVARKAGALVVELLIDGVLSNTLSEVYGFANVKQRLEQGTDLVVLPFQFLLAGPMGALAIGNDKLVRSIASHAQAIHGQMSGAQLAASTIALQLANLSDEIEAGVASQLLANAENLKNRSRRLAVQLNDIPLIREAVEMERQCLLGPTPWNRFHLNNWAVRVAPRGTVEQLQRELMRRDGNTVDSPLPIATAASSTHLYIDLRFIAPEDDHEIVLAATQVRQP